MTISRETNAQTAILLKRAEAAYAKALSFGESRKAKIVLNAFEELHNNANPTYLYTMQKLKTMPVTIDEFLGSRDFLGGDTNSPILDIWEPLKESIKEINVDVLAGEKAKTEVLFLGASGTGKTARSVVTGLYQLYLLDCIDWPQELWKLSRPTELVFMMLSIMPSTADKVMYKPFRQYFESMPYVRKYVNYRKDITSELRLDQNKVVRFASANVNSLVGHAVINGAIDEINFFAKVERSKQAADGGTFDQAQQVHSMLLNRRQSRFTWQGPSFGRICVSAQTNYKGDFTDRRLEQIRKYNEQDVIWFREKRYDVVPKERLTKETFKVLVGTDEYPTRIIRDGDLAVLPDNAVIEHVPMTYFDMFQRDPEYALREVVGIATNAITPFIAQRQKITEAMEAGAERELKPWTTQNRYRLSEKSTLNENGMPVIIEENIPDDGKIRYAHIDLSVTGDACGISVCHIDGYVDVENERLPVYVVDMAIALEPDSVNQVEIAAVRQWVLSLKTKYGIKLGRVSYDSYQSTESVQMIRKQGMNALQISVDRTTEPYMLLRDALYQNRIIMPYDEALKYELGALELNVNANNGKGKVDHSPLLQKDQSDALCGAVFNASMAGLTRAQTGPAGRPSARPRSNRMSSPRPSRNKINNDMEI